MIGWFYTLASMVALTGGAITLFSLRRASEAERAAAKRNAPSDWAIFCIWIAGLVGGAGVLLRKPWALHVLELFCYALVVLMCLSIYNRYRDLKRRDSEEHINWLAALGGLLIVGVPIMLIAYLTIATLRSDSVRALFMP
jgi:threonine/homoserine/homoserine lactone efflux protein